jgi:hypothetical protein
MNKSHDANGHQLPGSISPRRATHDQLSVSGSRPAEEGRGAVDILWIPLGAGAHVVRLSGRVFEATSAFLRRRERCDLYHSALEVHAPEGRYVIEQTPVPDADGALRGVVRGGAVGLRSAARFRVFRYEIRCWLDGAIPDAHEAVGGPVRLSEDLEVARRVLEAVPAVPTPVWGRDELRTGDMWNSNSVIAWLLCRSGLDVAAVNPPVGGRAPGWDAGVVVASRLFIGAGSRGSLDSHRKDNRP